ncbi:MAG: hypothetical protein U9R19_17635 [Bacteroidota bacterium]|nr:hypothetical protein [Bacteroidota bacterium]
MGTYLGYKYHHKAFTTQRSSSLPSHSKLIPKHGLIPSIRRAINERIIFKIRKQPDIYDFLGVKDYLKSISEKIPSGQKAEIIIELNDRLHDDEEIKNFDQLIKHVREKVDEFDYLRCIIIITFKFNTGRIFRKIINSECLTETSALDFGNAYRLKRKIEPLKYTFNKNKIKVLVHIRQGDTSVIETPWNTYIPVLESEEMAFTEFNTSEEIKTENRMLINDIYRFCSPFFENIGIDKLSTKIFSDGFERAFHAIYAYKEKLNFSNKQIDLLKQHQISYTQKAFGNFSSIENCKLIIGEEIEKLYDMIDSVFLADVVIVGTQNWMIPKFLSLFFNENNMPILVILYKVNKPHLKRFGMPGNNPRNIYVDIDNFDIDQITKQITKVLT